MKIIKIFKSRNNIEPFTKWFNSIKNLRVRAIIKTRLDRLAGGNYGDYKLIDNNLYELRIHLSPGFRIYYGELQDKIVILLIGGTKNSQAKDIKKAKHYWQVYMENGYE